MRAELISLSLLVALSPVLAQAEVTQPDTTRLEIRAWSPDTLRTPLPPDTTAAGRPLDMNAERKRALGSLEDALPLRRPLILAPLPFSGPTQGSLRVPDGDAPLRLEGWAYRAQTTTDEHLIGSVARGFGAPWVAFALDDPRGDAVEPLDLGAIEFPAMPFELLGPGDALGRTQPRSPAFASTGPDTGRAGLARTTLVYRRGSGDAQLTGARLEARAFHRRIYASFVRNQANGWAPLRESLTWRYALRAELGRLFAHRFEVEGLLFERAIEDSSVTPILFAEPGASEWERHAAGLRISHDGDRVRDAWRIGIEREKRTWIVLRDFNVTPDAGARERWEFPAVTAQGRLSLRAGGLTGIAWGNAASRRVSYRADSLPAFDPRRGEARGGLGARLGLGPSLGVGADAAYDTREGQSGFVDARASVWGQTGRARARFDLESAHERPTWMDLLTPPTLHDFFSPIGAEETQLVRSGDPTLRPRRLRGGLGFLGFSLGEGMDLELSGSYRRVTDDFGWDVTSDTTGGFLTISSLARQRGSGWLSHAGLSWELRRGPFHARGVAWVRGGPDSLTPRAGSPPRRAIDASLEARVSLFRGDLPLRFGVESHARGPRRGLIREPGQVTWDGTLSADFGPAGAFLRLQDVFDRRPGSAIWDPTIPTGAPMPGRTFQAGVVWNLLD